MPLRLPQKGRTKKAAEATGNLVGNKIAEKNCKGCFKEYLRFKEIQKTPHKYQSKYQNQQANQRKYTYHQKINKLLMNFDYY